MSLVRVQLGPNKDGLGKLSNEQIFLSTLEFKETRKPKDRFRDRDKGWNIGLCLLAIRSLGGQVSRTQESDLGKRAIAVMPTFSLICDNSRYNGHRE